MEGTKCPLAHYGYSRDKKKNKLQIEYGVIATKEGLPLGVKVFNGNTSDLASFRSVIEDIKTTHKLDKLIVIGDRGMFSATNIDKFHQVDPDYLYISALRSQQIRSLVESDAIQLGLFDDTDLFEISHPDYPGERLIACKNEELAKKRHQTRQALLEVAKTRLDKLQVAVSAGRIKTEAAIGRKIEA
ncbi:Transposase, IS4 family protein, partial [mine drainage metagenome]